MSYDLMVFDKNNVPKESSKFMDWYWRSMELECVEDIAYASEGLQKFFHLVREIFPPIDGPFALEGRGDEGQGMEACCCGYGIREDMVYLTLPYSVSQFAYNTVKRAAYFAGVGFYAPSNGGAPVFLKAAAQCFWKGNGSSP